MSAAAVLIGAERLAEALPLVDAVAQKLATRLPASVSVDDLRSAGHFALIDIVASHDQTCAPFEPYVRTRLEWAMIDEARRVTRSRTLDVKADMLRLSGARHVTTPSSRGPERIALNRARADAVRAALAFLDEELRTIVVRHHFEGQTLAQIGVALGRDKSWVSRLHARALEQLAALIRDSGVVSARW